MLQRYCLMLGVLMLLAGCAPSQPAIRIFWPAPPEQPRYEFIDAYASQDDFPKGAWQRIVEFLLGKPPLDFFQTPMDVAVDSRGRVYVSDLHLHNVRVYDFEQRHVSLLTPDALMVSPAGLAIDSSDNIYVCDGAQRQIVVFDRNWKFVRTISHEQLGKPVFLVFDEGRNRVYVSDAREHKVAVFDLAWNYLTDIGKGQLTTPNGLAVSPEGNIYVTENILARISVFAPDGNLLQREGMRGDAAGQFESPKDVAFGPDGLLYVVDARKPGVLVFDKDWQLLLLIGGKRGGYSKLALDSPGGIHVDAQGRILITDRLKRWFAVWQYITPDYLAKHPISDEELKKIEALQKAAEAAKAGRKKP